MNEISSQNIWCGIIPFPCEAKTSCCVVDVVTLSFSFARQRPYSDHDVTSTNAKHLEP